MIPLSELEAEFGTVQSMDDGTMRTYRCLWFKLGDTYHMLPFAPESVLNRVWRHTSGDTLEDITLLPSYVCGEVHGFIREGHWVPC